MEEEFLFDFSDDAQRSVERYEEMIRNEDQYFFDAQAFENIIDYYIDKSDPVKALQVIEYALNQHPYAAVFLVKQAQLFFVTDQTERAFLALQKAEMLEASEAEIYILRGNIYNSLERYSEALDNFQIALGFAETTDEILLQIAYVYQNMLDYEQAIVYIKQSLEQNMENKDGLYELAFCYDILDKQEESIQFYQEYIDNDPYSYAAWYNLANSYHKLDLFEKAIDAYDYAILIKDNFDSDYYNK